MKQGDLFPAPPAVENSSNQQNPKSRAEYQHVFSGEGCEPRDPASVPLWLRIEGVDETKYNGEPR